MTLTPNPYPLTPNPYRSNGKNAHQIYGSEHLLRLLVMIPRLFTDYTALPPPDRHAQDAEQGTGDVRGDRSDRG